VNVTQPVDEEREGMMFVPGFGWIVDEGGGVHCELSVGTGSLDEIIGY
jgi:hypothetical protein